MVGMGALMVVRENMAFNLRHVILSGKSVLAFPRRLVEIVKILKIFEIVLFGVIPT